MKLDRIEIVDAAFALLQEEGIKGLTLRKLAARLGVRAPAIYWYIPTKAELMHLMAARLTNGARESCAGETHWRAWLLAFGRAVRTAFLAHRDSSKLYAEAGPIPADPGEIGDQIAAPLMALGLSREQALAYQGSVISLSLGWALFEQTPNMRELLSGMMDMEASFDQGLQAMVAGFPAKQAVAPKVSS
jgi:TetR/AcrR family tetracycline transcriptional repressor